MVRFMAETHISRPFRQKLTNWGVNRHSSGLILFGARQTGKTILVGELSKKFRQFIRMDMKDPEDLEVFRRSGAANEFLERLFLLKGKDFATEDTLIFFDSVCVDPQVITLAEEILKSYPQFKIVISSSMLLPQVPREFETLFLFPFSFREFLAASGNKEAIESFDEVPFPVSGFHKLLGLFHQYALIGGMPSVVSKYVQTRSLSALKPVYDEILECFFTQIAGSPFRQGRKDLLTVTLQNSFLYAGTRIKFNEFGNVPYGSREMAGIFRYLESSLMLSLYYPAIRVIPPVQPDKNKFPRLQLLDTGLVSYFSGIQKKMILATDLNALFKGQVLRHVVGQELLSTSELMPPRLDFWVRGKAQSSAEVDYLLDFEGMVIPVTVKSGEPGRLRSLHQFIDEAPHPFAVRLYAGNVNIRKAVTLRGKPYYLLSLPYFLACRIREHVGGFITYVGKSG